MNVSLKTQDAHDAVFAYDVHRLELKTIGDQTQVSLQAEGTCGMSTTAYVRTLHFTAEVGTLPSRFICPHCIDTASGIRSCCPFHY